jgi:hypothetical protein
MVRRNLETVTKICPPVMPNAVAHPMLSTVPLGTAYSHRGVVPCERRTHIVSVVASGTVIVPRLRRGAVPVRKPTSNVATPDPEPWVMSTTLSRLCEYHRSDEYVPPGSVTAVSVVACQVPGLTYRNAWVLKPLSNTSMR